MDERSMIERAKVAALVALAEHAATTDVQELLVQGNPSRSVPPGALDKMIRAAIEALAECTLVMREDGQVVHELRGAPNDIWQAMLKAALASPSPSHTAGER